MEAGSEQEIIDLVKDLQMREFDPNFAVKKMTTFYS